MKKKNDKKAKQYPVVQLVSLTVISVAVCVLSAMLFVLITSYPAVLVIKIFCVAVLSLLPAFVTKVYMCIRRIRDKRVAFWLCMLGMAVSLIFSFCYYISHDYSMSVYRYMKKTDADVYYYGGYESFESDYADTADFIRQMKNAPASIVLESMSDEKLAKLSADDLKKINSESLWKHLGFDDILGTTEEEVAESMEKSKDMNAYDFTFEYRGLRAKTMGYMLLHPLTALDELKTIAEDGSLYSVSFPFLMMFFAGQIILFWMIIRRFDLTRDGKIVYLEIRGKKSGVES